MDIVDVIVGMLGAVTGDSDEALRIIGLATSAVVLLKACVSPLRRLADRTEARWDNRAVEMLARVLGAVEDALPLARPRMLRRRKDD